MSAWDHALPAGERECPTCGACRCSAGFAGGIHVHPAAGACRCEIVGWSRDPYEPHIPAQPEWEQADDCPVHPLAERGAGRLTLTDFLLARIAEDESIGRDWQLNRGKVQVNGGGTGYLRLADPARVLAECEAKRRIVEDFLNVERQKADALAEYGPNGWRGDMWMTATCRAIQHLALPYADHPDYRDEWKP